VQVMVENTQTEEDMLHYTVAVQVDDGVACLLSKGKMQASA